MKVDLKEENREQKVISMKASNDSPRISVIIITYNQEDVIRRAIDSLVKQIDYIFEVCISDDCSNDKTWDILMEYKDRYPAVFNLHRNEPNLGIFQNVEQSWTMPHGNIIYQLAGDDEVPEGWFKAVIDYIRKGAIAIQEDLFCIYGDYKAVYPNGDSFIQQNKRIESGVNPLKLALRGLVCNRSCCYSARILKKYKTVSQGKSYIAEGAQDRQLQVWTEKNYYIPEVGNIYYTGIGVSTSISDKRKEQHMARWDYLLDNLKRWGVEVDRKDRNYIEFRKAKERHSYVLSLFYFIGSIDPKLGISGLRLRRIFFAIYRRFPFKRRLVDFKV